MKLTRNRLKELIVEELNNIVVEWGQKGAPDRAYAQQTSLSPEEVSNPLGAAAERGIKPAAEASGVPLVKKQLASNRALQTAFASINTLEGVKQVLNMVTGALTHKSITPLIKTQAYKQLLQGTSDQPAKKPAPAAGVAEAQIGENKKRASKKK